ncbi:MAG: hypothetical protein ACYDG3_07275, partial [Bacillati bacterium]
MSSTIRPYDLELRDHRADLYRTHVAMNNAVEATLDWLLTVRGGLPAMLAFAPDLDEHAQAERVIMLTRSWFVPERLSQHDADEPPSIARLEHILASDGLTAAQQAFFIEHARDLLAGNIRDDARWIDRRAIYDAQASEFYLSPEAVEDILFASNIFDLSFLTLRAKRTNNCIQAARGWLSRRAGSGTGANFAALGALYRAIATVPDIATPRDLAIACQAASLIELMRLMQHPGHRSRTIYLLQMQIFDLPADEPLAPEMMNDLREAAAGDAQKCATKPAKGRRPWSDAWIARIDPILGLPFRGHRDHLSEYASVLDLAARRLSSQHTWAALAETERRARTIALRQGRATIHPAALAWLDAYTAKRATELGISSVTFDERTIAGWDELTERWHGLTTPAQRREALIEYRATSRRGDSALFEALAGDDADEVRTHPDAVTAYAALPNPGNLVPAIAHVDPHDAPVWMEYGTSRWSIRAQERLVTLATINAGTIAPVTIRAKSDRLTHDLLAIANGREANVPRNDSLGQLLAEQPTPPTASIDNGRLTTDRQALKHLGALPETERGVAAAKLPWRITFSAELPQHPRDPRLNERLRALKGVKGKGRPALSGIPHLRVMGVDLGLRHAAACSVVETVDAKELHVALKAANEPTPRRDALFVRIPGGTTYRRIGDDGSPAPWARIEQTWTMRLPGERPREHRLASPDEQAWLQSLKASLGFSSAPVRTIVELLDVASYGILRTLRHNNALVRILVRLRDQQQEVRLAALEQLEQRLERPGNRASTAE